MNDLVSILLLTSFGSIIALIGGIIFLTVKPLSHVLTKYSIPFAAGVLMTVTLTGLIPEAHHMLGESAFTHVLLSFFAAYLFENLFFDLHHHDCDEKSHHHTGSIPLVIVGDTIHNFIDGVAIAASYMVNPGLGLATAISTFLHEVPHEVGDFGIMLKSGFSKTKIFTINLLSSLSAFAGALMVVFFSTSEAVNGVLLSFAAGLFLYLGASDFLPKAASRQDKIKSILVILVGIAVMLSTLYLIPHTHQ
jgi:zinc and cadmium transporter